MRWPEGYRRALTAGAIACGAASVCAQAAAWESGRPAEIGRAVVVVALSAFGALFWARLVLEKGDVRHVSPERTLGAVLLLGGLAIAVAFSDPRTLIVNAFWWVVSVLAIVGVAEALGSRRHAVLAAEGMLALVLLHAFGQPESRRYVEVGPGNGVSWAFSFERADQKIVKLFPRPDTWDSPLHDTVVRADLAGPYQGPAGYEVWVNGQRLGALNGYTPEAIWGGPGGPRWAVTVPSEVLARDPLVTVEVRPDGIDPALAIAGHGDALVALLGREATWLFDGKQWTRDRLAGARGGLSQGTYRLWLVSSLRPPPETSGT